LSELQPTHSTPISSRQKDKLPQPTYLNEIPYYHRLKIILLLNSHFPKAKMSDGYLSAAAYGKFPVSIENEANQ
jgi:hypothetical protein